MTIEDAQKVLEFAMLYYPGFVFSNEKKKGLTFALANEFKQKPIEMVIEAFKIASEQSLDRPPSLPRIKAALAEIEARIMPDSGDDFGGLSKEEWESREAWFATDEGKKAMQQNMERINEIIKGMRVVDK